MSKSSRAVLFLICGKLVSVGIRYLYMTRQPVKSKLVKIHRSLGKICDANVLEVGDMLINNCI